MSRRIHRLAAAAAVLLLAGLVTGSPPASAEDDAAGPAEDCVLSVIGQEVDGELIVEGPTCYSSLTDALVAAGAEVDPASDLTVADLAADSGAARAVAASSVLAVHYDGSNLTGATLTVNGGACSGGYTNLSASWINRISSTLNYCPTVRHYDGYNLTGSSQVTTSTSWNLTSLNNLANSVQYS